MADIGSTAAGAAAAAQGVERSMLPQALTQARAMHCAWCCCLQGYDQTIIPLVVVIVLVSVGALGSLVGLLVFHVRAAVYARPLSYHLDVLNQK
jgi:hypothetical protein